ATLNLPSGYAGALGQFFGRLLRENFQGFGTFLILVYCALAALLFTIDGFWTGMTRTVAGGTQLAGGMLSAAAAGVSSAAASAVGAAVGTASSLIKRPSLAGSLAGRATSRARSAAVKPVIANKRTATAAVAEAEMEDDATTDEPDDSPAPAKASAAQKVKPLTFRRHDTESNESAGCYPAVLDDWVLPPLSLLEDVEYSSTVQQETEARKKAKILEQTLRDFKIEAPVVEIETGPVITMFQLQLAPGTKVGQITALSNDIARSMRAPAVRVVATIAGKNTIGIEVPRLDREKVRLRELMNVAGKKAQQMALPLFLGSLYGWHIPAAYNTSLENEWVHLFMHFTMFTAAVLFWWPIVGPPPVRTPLSYPQRIVFLLLAVTPAALLAAVITLSKSVIFEFYLDSPGHFGWSPTEDQRIGGLLMWIPGNFVFLTTMTILFFRWFAEEERKSFRKAASRPRRASAAASSAKPSDSHLEYPDDERK
ncbi:MAG: cytochrome c oxidase assembly protein, partial [Chloroflexi bacterium]|nr:cytochrome c oxidase assembly protein [Chloroflexota bacterium]